ncbi:MAG: TatD family hydrolase [Spirochaetales bacterium]
MRLFDAHCHLQASVFESDREAVFARARAAGVEGFVVCATEPGDWDDVEALARTEAGVIPAFGVHPWYLPEGQTTSDWLAPLEARLLAWPHAWVGEIGLDRSAGPPLELQEAAFAPQLALAGKLGRVATVHCRRTWDRLNWYLARRSHPEVPVVMHSFSASWPVAQQLLELGAWFSFSGALTRTRNQRLPQVFAALPRDRVLLETDSPDLLPEALWRENPDRANESAHLLHVLNVVARLWGCGPEEASLQLWKNTQRITGGFLETPASPA